MTLHFSEVVSHLSFNNQTQIQPTPQNLFIQKINYLCKVIELFVI